MEEKRRLGKGHVLESFYFSYTESGTQKERECWNSMSQEF